jgi:hypothetical protein
VAAERIVVLIGEQLVWTPVDLVLTLVRRALPMAAVGTCSRNHGGLLLDFFQTSAPICPTKIAILHVR